MTLVLAMMLTLGALASAGPAGAAGPPGSFDSSFGSGGVASLGAGTQLFGVAVQANGEVVAAGQSGGSVLVERFGATGQPDGVYTGPSGYARAVAVESNGDIVIAGASGGAMLVERLTSSLTPDSSFGSGGVETAFAGQSGEANGVAVEADGSIVAAGSVNTGPTLGTQVAVARFTATGPAQWSHVINFGANSVANAVAVQPADGKIVLVGTQQPSQVTNGVVARLNGDGSSDGTFRGGGAFTYSYPNTGVTVLTSVALQVNGQIVAAGAEDSGPHALTVRFNSDGSTDTTFGTGGVAALPSGQDVQAFEYPIGAYAVGIGGGGTVIAAGNFENTGTDVDAALYAFTASGAPEAAFGSAGTARGPSGGYEACALAIAPDGSLVAVGNSVTTVPDSSPCAFSAGASAFVTRSIGYGPPPQSTPSSGAAPTVTTGPASAVTQLSANLSGDVNPNGLATSYAFQYGTTTAYGSTTTATSAGSGTAAVPVSVSLKGLSPGTQYHYRIAATNARGSSDGKDETFTTAPAGPAHAMTGSARVTEISATVSGIVDTNGLPTTYHVEYGRTKSYGSKTSARTVAAAISAVSVGATLKALHPGTTYHYRLVAGNADGISVGADETFTTEPYLKAALYGVSSSYSIASIIQKGLSFKVGCNQPCSIKGSLVISSSTAKAFALGKRKLSIGRGSASLKKSGKASLRVRLTKAAKKAIANHSFTLTLQAVASPVGGGRTVTPHRTIKFKP